MQKRRRSPRREAEYTDGISRALSRNTRYTRGAACPRLSPHPALPLRRRVRSGTGRLALSAPELSPSIKTRGASERAKRASAAAVRDLHSGVAPRIIAPRPPPVGACRRIRARARANDIYIPINIQRTRRRVVHSSDADAYSANARYFVANSAAARRRIPFPGFTSVALLLSRFYAPFLLFFFFIFSQIVAVAGHKPSRAESLLAIVSTEKSYIVSACVRVRTHVRVRKRIRKSAPRR